MKCKECPLEYTPYCIADLLEEAHDLIQRQQERMDRIIEELERNSWKAPKEPNRLIWLEKAIAIVKGEEN